MTKEEMKNEAASAIYEKASWIKATQTLKEFKEFYSEKDVAELKGMINMALTLEVLSEVEIDSILTDARNDVESGTWSEEE